MAPAPEAAPASAVPPPPASTRKHVEATCPQLVVEERVMADGHAAKPRQYVRGRFLGKGGFAVVYELQEVETGDIFAGKVRGGAGNARAAPPGSAGTAHWASAGRQSAANAGGRASAGTPPSWPFQIPSATARGLFLLLY